MTFQSVISKIMGGSRCSVLPHQWAGSLYYAPAGNVFRLSRVLGTLSAEGGKLNKYIDSETKKKVVVGYAGFLCVFQFSLGKAFVLVRVQRMN